MATQAPPPGQRLLPATIDEIAQADPDRIWASLPFDDYDLSQGYEDITYAAFANAINKLAWFVVETVGRSTTFETVAYLGVPDVRYHMIQMAVCKTGHKVLFTSHLNSSVVHQSLLQRTECKAVFYARGVRVDDLLAARPMAQAAIPELDDLLDLQDVAPPFPYTKTFAEAKNDPWMVLHSSGTTGDPRPIVYTHAGIATLDAQKLMPKREGRQRLSGLNDPGARTRVLLVTSPYHVLSAGLAMVMSVLGSAIFVPGFRHKGVGLDDVADVLAHANVGMAMLTPWMMESMARRPDAQKYIEPLKTVFFGGAAMSPHAIDLWGKYTKIQNVWGSTETGSLPFLEADNEDAAYVFFDMDYSGLEFRKVSMGPEEEERSSGEPPMYEMVFTMSPQTAPYACWHALNNHRLEAGPPYPEYAIGDLWTPHPDPEKAAYAWKFVGRSDDLLQLSPGINLHPGTMERLISSQGVVSGVLVLGNGHQQPVALVELAEGKTEADAADLWDDYISPHNEEVPAQGVITRSHVIFVPSGSFLRTTKGSVIRRQTEHKFHDLIESVYKEHGDVWQDRHRRYGSIVATFDMKVESTPHTEVE